MMNRTKRALTGLIAIGLGAALVPTLGGGAASAAPGAQPAPTLTPSATATGQFSFTVDGNPHCDGTTADNWRAHTFIVDGDADLSSLDFSGDAGAGVPGGWVGVDFDATDGSIAAPLFVGSDPRVNVLPANSPAGLIDPGQLQGFSFDPSIGWMLVDGVYQIGFACVGPTAGSLQWWANTVTLDVHAPRQFMQEGDIVLAPELTGVTPGIGQFTATFTPHGPADSYTVTAVPVGGGSTVTATDTGSPITVTGVVDGTTYDVSVTATRDAETSAASNVLQVTPGDTTPPGTPTVNIEDPIDVSNHTSVTVNGTGEEGATAHISVDDTNAGTAAVTDDVTVGPSGYTAEIDTSTLDDGTITATVTLEDAAGNDSGSASDTATKDTLPAAPAVTLTDPIGVSNETSVTVSGSGEDGTANVSVDDSNAGTPAVETTVPVSGGVYSATGLDVSGLDDGTLTATVTVDNGVQTGPAGTDTATKSTVPTVVFTPDEIDADNQTAVVISGTAKDGEATISVDDEDPETPAIETNATVTGNAYSSAPLDLTGLSDGTLTATVTVDGQTGTGTAEKVTTTDPISPILAQLVAFINALIAQLLAIIYAVIASLSF